MGGDSAAPRDLRTPRLPALRSLIVISDESRLGFLRFRDVADLARPGADDILDRRAAAMQPDDPINIQFTSGTTGFPKGATLSHFNVLNNGYFTAEGMRLGEEDRLCIPVPLYHCFGMVLSVLASVTHGAAMVFPSAGFDAAEVLAAVEAERCTALHGVPTMFVAELDHPDRGSRDLSSLRTGIMAGSPCPIEVMRGYWGDDERTREAIDQAGWMHSGDLATLDADGYCNIVGRLKDMIIRGGENIYPREIEEFLYRHGKIREVAVFGVPDEKFGEQIAAWIRLEDGAELTADEVRDFCRGQIAHYKIPAYVKFVDEFPMTVTGKLQKFVMREAMAAELGLREQKTA